jgi:tRNA pseudouridine38-40 synthase
MRLRLDLEYDGTDFAGWQRQPGLRTVQGVIEEILKSVLEAPAAVTGAGRTDRGCHATGQVAHFDYAGARPPAEIAGALAALFPADLRLRRLAVAAGDFHARYGAIERAYDYRIARRRSVLDRRTTWALGERLDLAALRAASAGLRGRHDFRGYAVRADASSEDGSRSDQGHPGICHVFRADWDIAAGGYRFTIVADRFLTRMVRLLVGIQVEVGRGRLDPEVVAAHLDGQPPQPRPPAAPAAGLRLAWVRYAGEAERGRGSAPAPA